MTHGRHIKIIGLGNADLLRDVERIKTLLVSMVDLLGMRCLGQPHMYEVEEEISKLGVEPFEDEGGVTGVVVLSTSHCAIHTWPLRSYFVMDVFSCRDFDSALVEPMLKNFLHTTRLKMTDLTYALIPDTSWELEAPGEIAEISA